MLTELASPAVRLVTELVLRDAMEFVYLFVLVLVRMSGLMIVGPMFGQKVVPGNVRVLLVFVLALIVTPTLLHQASLGAHRMDADENGVLVRDEVPDHLKPRFDQLLAESGRPENASLRLNEFSFALKMPRTLMHMLIVVVGEFALGFVLGFGVVVVLAALQLVGELFDQQTGISLGAVFNPGLGIQGAVTGQFLFLLGTTLILSVSTNGHLLMLDALLDTFQSLPIGDAYVRENWEYQGELSANDMPPVIARVSKLVHLSFLLAMQVAVPLLAVTSLITIAMGYLGFTVPQINILVVGFPIRAMANIIVLLLTLSGVVRMVVNQIPIVIKDSLEVLTQLT